MEFNYGAFVEVIEEINSFRYSFLQIDEDSLEDQQTVLYLRHDVDFFRACCRSFGRAGILRRRDIQLFSLLSADT